MLLLQLDYMFTIFDEFLPNKTKVLLIVNLFALYKTLILSKGNQLSFVLHPSLFI